MKQTALYNHIALREAGLALHGIIGNKTIVSGISIDSRKVQNGDLFFCLPGENTDGHSFAVDALLRGAAGIVILKSRYSEIIEELGKRNPDFLMQPSELSVEARISKSNRAIIAVENVLDSMWQLANYQRSRFTGIVYGVTGSNGKTTVKEMLASMLEHLSAGNVWYTQGNLNNHIGVPMTVASIPLTAKFAVIEMGMNHAGEISRLTSLSRPDHALISSIGRAHIEFFDSILGIAAAKLEIAESLRPQSVLVYPLEATGRELYERTVDAFGLKGILSHPEKIISISTEGVKFQSNDLNLSNSSYFSNEAAINLTSCLNLLLHSGLNPSDYNTTWEQIVGSAKPQTQGRFTVFKNEKQLLVDDTYNANPDSFIASVRSICNLMGDSARILIIAGSMAELGHESENGHRETGEQIAANGCELLACGSMAKYYEQGYTVGIAKTEKKSANSADLLNEGVQVFSDTEQLIEFLKKQIETGDNRISQFDAILVKGSRSARMERIVRLIQEQWNV